MQEPHSTKFETGSKEEFEALVAENSTTEHSDPNKILTSNKRIHDFVFPIPNPFKAFFYDIHHANRRRDIEKLLERPIEVDEEDTIAECCTFQVSLMLHGAVIGHSRF